MKRTLITCAAAGLALTTAPSDGSGTAAAAPGKPNDVPPFEKFAVEGQPVDRRPPELETDHPVFQARLAPFHKTMDVVVTTIATGLDVPWAVELLPSGRFLITEKARPPSHPEQGRVGRSIPSPRTCRRSTSADRRAPRRCARSELRHQPPHLLLLCARR